MAKRAIPIPESDEEEEEEEVFEVSKILDHKHSPKAGLQYLIRWKGYEDPSEDTWEPESNVNETASAKVKAYWRTVSADRRGDQKLSKLAATPSAALAKKRRSSEQSARGKGKVQVHDSEEDEDSRPPPKKAKATAPTSNAKRAPNSTSPRKKPAVPVESENEDEEEEKDEEKKTEEEDKDKKDDKRRNGTKSNEKADAKKEPAADEQDAGSNGDDILDGYEAEGEETDYHLTRYADLPTFDVSSLCSFHGGVPSSEHPNLIGSRAFHSWQDIVDHIETIVAGDEKDGHRMMAVWSIDGTHSYLPEAIWRRKCPQAALDFFVKHLKFKSINVDVDAGDDA